MSDRIYFKEEEIYHKKQTNDGLYFIERVILVMNYEDWFNER